MINIGNGNWAVKEDNLLGYRYDETEGVYFPREMTFGRACDTTRVNPDGLIERVPYNLILQSNTFDTTWGNASTFETGGQPDKDGGTDAWLLTNTSSNGRIEQSIVQSGILTFSVYAKANTTDKIRLRVQGAQSNTADFNLTSGTNTGTGGSNYIANSITELNDGWYRISITVNETTTRVYIYILDVSGKNLYIQDAQLVEGTESKPYFPTTNRQDIARIDYSSGTGALLLEPQRTNYALYSNDIHQWNNLLQGDGVITTTSNYAISPDGLQNATRIVASATGVNYALKSVVATTSTTGSYVVSLYLKSNTANSQEVAIYGRNTTNVETVTTEWQRFEVLCSGSSSYLNIGVNQNFGGNTSIDILAWGGQIEHATYATSLIPTTSASVTRLADSCYKTGVADWIGQTEGTLFVEASTLVNGADGRITISDGTINNRVSIEWDIDADTIKGFIGVGGNVSTTSHDQTDRNKIALVYSTSFAKLFVNGTLVATDTSSIPTMSGMAHIEYSNYGGTTPFVGNLYQTIVIPTALTDADAITLTTI